MTSTPLTSVRVTAVVAALVLGASACGDDDDEASAEYVAMCEAELAIEEAISAEDQAAIEAGFEDIVAAAPEEAAATVEATVESARAFLEAGGDPTPEFEAAYADLIQLVKDECGFETLDVTAQNYSFEGIDDELDAGPTVVSLANEANEYHEVVLIRKNDGVTMSAEELLALPEEEAMEMTTFVGAAFAAPEGGDGYTVVDLQPGSYVAVCFLPIGATEAAFQEMQESGVEPDGAPHFTNGMLTEFEVAG